MEHKAHGIIVFIARLVFVEFLIQNLHFNAVGKFVHALRAVFSLITLQGVVMFRALCDRGIALFHVILIDLRGLVRECKIDDRFAFVAFEHARRGTAPGKARDMILVSVCRDDIFERTVRTVSVNIFRSRIGAVRGEPASMRISVSPAFM